jgi:hypothetical protein
MNTQWLETSLAFAIPLFNALFLGAAVIFDSYFFHFSILGIIVMDVLLYLYCGHEMRIKEIVRIAGLPFINYLSTAGALFFSNSTLLSALLIASPFILQSAYFIIQRGAASLGTNPPAVAQISMLLCIGTFFPLSVLFFSLIYFLDLPFWRLILPFLLLAGMAQEAALHSLKIDRYQSALIGLVSAIAITELLYALSWLPLEYIPLASLATLFYALFLDMLVCSLSAECSKKRMLFSGIFVFGMVALVSVLTRWR